MKTILKLSSKRMRKDRKTSRRYLYKWHRVSEKFFKDNKIDNSYFEEIILYPINWHILMIAFQLTMEETS